MLNRMGSTMFMAVKLSLIITVLLSITLCCAVSVRADFSACSAFNFPGTVLSLFGCAQAVSANVKSANRMSGFVLCICVLLGWADMGASCLQQLAVGLSMPQLSSVENV